MCPASRPHFDTLGLRCAEPCTGGASWAEALNRCVCEGASQQWDPVAQHCATIASTASLAIAAPSPVVASPAVPEVRVAPRVETQSNHRGDSRPFERLALDVGIGVSGAIAQNVSYNEAQSLIDGVNSVTDCNGSYCSSDPSPDLQPMYFLHGSVRIQASRDVGIGLAIRWQFSSASWEYPSRDALPAKVNLLSDLLVVLRIYRVLGRSSSNGFRFLGFMGGGVGQVSPQIRSPALAEGAHVASGMFEAQVGLRLEGRLEGPLYLGAEVVGHVLAPTVLFGLDGTVFTGLAF